MHGSQAAWQTFQHGRWNITYSLTWQRRSFSFPLPVWLYSMVILLGSQKILFGDQLTFKGHIVKTARSCRFALHNIRRIGHFQTEYAAQLLAQALVTSRLDYCNFLLAELPSWAIKPRQMIQNAAAWLVFHKPKRPHFTPLFISQHWVPAAGLYQVQDIDVCVQNSQRLITLYFLLTFTKLHPLQKPEIWK